MMKVRIPGSDDETRTTVHQTESGIHISSDYRLSPDGEWKTWMDEGQGVSFKEARLLRDAIDIILRHAGEAE